MESSARRQRWRRRTALGLGRDGYNNYYSPREMDSDSREMMSDLRTWLARSGEVTFATVIVATWYNENFERGRVEVYLFSHLPELHLWARRIEIGRGELRDNVTLASIQELARDMALRTVTNLDRLTVSEAVGADTTAAIRNVALVPGVRAMLDKIIDASQIESLQVLMSELRWKVPMLN